MTTTPTSLSVTLFQMPYTSGDGVSHPQSVWFPASVDEDNADETVDIVFRGYHDLAAFGAGDSPLQYTKEYRLTAAQYGQFAGEVLPGQNGALTFVGANWELISAIALGTADTPASPPATNVDGSPVLVSFFASATTVTVQLPS